MTAPSLGLPIVVRNLVVSFARYGQTVTAVDKLSFDVGAGEWVLLVGHNGAGKSTVLSTIAGRILPDSGDVRLNGHPVQALPPAKLAAQIFLIHQDPMAGTASLLTVFENLLVADPAAIRAEESRANLRNRYGELLEPIGLAHRLKQPAKLLSGGERQLLAMVIAGLRGAPIILLDEPLAAMDPTKVVLCIEQISQMHAAGKTIIQISHEIRDLQRVADRILTMRNGRLLSDQSLSAARVAKVAP